MHSCIPGDTSGWVATLLGCQQSDKGNCPRLRITYGNVRGHYSDPQGEDTKSALNVRFTEAAYAGYFRVIIKCANANLLLSR